MSPTNLSLIQSLIQLVGPGAAIRFTLGQKVLLAIIMMVLLAVITMVPEGYLWVLRVLVALCTIYYLVTWLYAMVVVSVSLKNGILKVTDSDVASDGRRRWPFISIVIAMYDEATVASMLVANLRRIEYPDFDHEVLFVLEERDTSTIKVLESLEMPAHYRIIVRPANHPSKKTKPGAVMYAVKQVGLNPRSRLFAIYDAEDHPDPMQLKKAVIAYEKAKQEDPTVVCVQGILSFANSTENWLTRMSSLDYATHFNLILPGLAKLGLVAPLGGTTNFIETDVIEVLGYDESNVTEDLNLAVMLFLAGLKTRVFSSVTMEEALHDPQKWIAQRSRWLKGGLQTYVVHNRHPFFVLKRRGVVGMLSLHLTVGGPVLSAVINPIFWGLTLTYGLTGWEFVQQLYAGPIFHLASLSFLFGNFCFVYVSVVAAIKTQQYSNAFFAVFAPLYWALMSVAGWRAVYEFLTPKLHSWSKTQHIGLSSQTKTVKQESV